MGSPLALATGAPGLAGTLATSVPLVRVTCKEFCAPPQRREVFDVLATTVGDAKRAVAASRPGWTVESMMMSDKRGPRPDDARVDGGDLVCLVACVCRDDRFANLFLPADAARAPEPAPPFMPPPFDPSSEID